MKSEKGEHVVEEPDTCIDVGLAFAVDRKFTGDIRFRSFSLNISAACFLWHLVPQVY